jgi:hypothetical protein
MERWPTVISGSFSKKFPYQITSELVLDCHQSLILLSKHTRFQLIWVPGPECIVVNETADQLARIGSEHPFIGPAPAGGISVGLAKRAVRDWMNRGGGEPFGIRNWTHTGKGTYTRALCQKNEGSVEIKQRPIKMGLQDTVT